MKTPSPPTYQQPPPDPALAAQEQQAQQDKVTALQDKLQGDTSSIMSRYGALMALSGAAK